MCSGQCAEEHPLVQANPLAQQTLFGSSTINYDTVQVLFVLIPAVAYVFLCGLLITMLHVERVLLSISST